VANPLPDPSDASSQYTTMTVKEYNHLRSVILLLRERLQIARQALELGLVEKTLELLRAEE
jgi:hypothetical protein